jgi:hypothetical protein
MATDKDLTMATKAAIQEMIDFLAAIRGPSSLFPVAQRRDAYPDHRRELGLRAPELRPHRAYVRRVEDRRSRRRRAAAGKPSACNSLQTKAVHRSGVSREGGLPFDLPSEPCTVATMVPFNLPGVTRPHPHPSLPSRLAA